MILWSETFRPGWLTCGDGVNCFYLPVGPHNRPLAAAHTIALHTLFRLLKPNEFWL